MRALVTGCAGFIGSHLSASLLGGGHEVVGVDVMTDNYARADKLRNLALVSDDKRFSFVPADLASDPLGDLFGGCDVVFHLAGEPGVRASFGARRALYARNNVEATRRLVEAAPSGVRMVLGSSSSVYGEAERLPVPEAAPVRPRSPYAETKAAAERCWPADGVILRFFTVYGPRQRPDMAFARFIEAARRGRAIELYGSRSRDFTFVGDAVSALMAELPPGTYNVGGGSAASLVEVIDLLARLAGPIAVRQQGAQRGDVRATLADTARLRAHGWEPRVDLKDGLREQWLAADPGQGLLEAAR